MATTNGLKQITIHTDGACDGNPGPGGWAAILRYGKHVKEISGGEPATTNNRMELMAAIQALAALKRTCEVNLFTDSQYLRNGITKWISGWKKYGWRTAEKTPVKNQDLWRQLDALISKHRVRWHWVRGHAGHRENERCDKLACREAARVRKRFTPQELSRLQREFKLNRDSATPLQGSTQVNAVL